MRNLLVAMMAMMSVKAMAAGDALERELSCAAVVPSEMNDFALRVDLFAGLYAWAKVARVYEEGNLGERLLLSANLPLYPQETNEGLLYASKGVRLFVPNGGSGEGKLTLTRGEESAAYRLHCEAAS